MDSKDKCELFKIDDYDFVTLTRMNHISEIQYLQKQNTMANTLKLSSDEYLVLDTGEIKEYKKNENRSENINSLLKTMKKLRYLINNNFTGSNRELFITLTYQENMTDLKRLYNDFSKFIKRLRYKYKHLELDYINVVEPQERGAWHCHVLLRANNGVSLYISNEDLARLWGHGFVRVNRLENIDNIGAYVTSYLTDIIVSDDVPLSDEIVEKEITLKDNKSTKVTKKIKKNGRLVLYPSGTNFYRKSKGIKFPERYKFLYKDIKKGQLGKLTYEKNIEFKNDNFENMIRYEYYNRKR